MLFARPIVALALAIGLLTGVMTTSSLMADDDHAHADGHDHASMTEKKVTESLAKLSPEDRKFAEAQRFCPVMQYSRLGAMGAPIKLTIEGKPVFVCCKACSDDAVAGGNETVAKVDALKKASAVLAKLSPEDRTAAEAQKFCSVANHNLLGSMDAPIKLVMEGKPVFLCCKGCVTKAQANPTATLAKVEALKKAGMDEAHDDAHAHADHKK